MDIESERKSIYELVDKSKYHAAMNIAISAVNECRRDKNQAGVDSFLDVIKNIANRMAEEYGS